jgi:thiol-disulfide isomerase/thioredoxin
MSEPGEVVQSADRSLWVNLGVLAVVVLAVFVVFHFRVFGSPNPEDHPAVGRKLPLLDLQPLTGNAPAIKPGDLKGKVVLVHFWTTWSLPSREGLPRIAAIEKQSRDQSDFRLVAISCGKELGQEIESLRGDTVRLLGELKLDLPTYADSTGTTLAAATAIGEMTHVPTTFLLDRDGTIRAVWPDSHSGAEKEMRRLIATLLVEPGVEL